MEYGLRHTPYYYRPYYRSLNPCCNGIWSQTLTCRLSEVGTKVLILVVMEYGLRPVRIMESKVCFVLILVVMEYGLRP